MTIDYAPLLLTPRMEDLGPETKGREGAPPRAGNHTRGPKPTGRNRTNQQGREPDPNREPDGRTDRRPTDRPTAPTDRRPTDRPTETGGENPKRNTPGGVRREPTLVHG